jgi:hypothetical protein
MPDDRDSDKPRQISIAQIFLEELVAASTRPRSWWRQAGLVLWVPLLAVFTGLLLEAVIIILTTEEVYAA